MYLTKKIPFVYYPFSWAQAETQQDGEVSILRLLGAGACGRVYLGLDPTGVLVAIKRLMMEGSHESMLSLLATEVNVLRRLRHPHIVQFLGLYRSKQEPTVYNIIMEYIDGGALGQLLHRMGKFPEAYAAAIVKQILHGLVYLHNQQIIHRYALVSLFVLCVNYRASRVCE